MEQIFIILFFASFIGELKAQSSELRLHLTQQDFFTRSKHQQTAALVLAGAGLVGMLAGMRTAVQHMSFSLSFYGNAETQHKDNPGAGLFIAGATVFAAGLGFAVAALINKNKANKASVTTLLKMENASFLVKQGKGEAVYPAVAFQFRL